MEEEKEIRWNEMREMSWGLDTLVSFWYFKGL